MPTHLTFLIDNLQLAGTQTVLRYLVEGLGARGYDQRVLCLNDRYDPGMVSALEASGARVEIIGKRQLMSGYGLLRIHRVLRETEILQTFLPYADLIGRILGHVIRVPVVVTSIRARNIDKPTWLRFLDRRTMGWADRVVFNARSVVAFSQVEEGVLPEQVVVIPNGVRVPEVIRRDRSVLAGIVPPDVPVIGTVGRLSPQKGHEGLLEAFALLTKEVAAQLVIVGDGEQLEHLKGRVRDLNLEHAVHFLGARRDLVDLYAAFDVYAHAAVFEGMPNAVMEAMAAGLPVVATDVDGASELIQDGVTGCLVPVGDRDAFAVSLRQVLSDPDHAREMGEAAVEVMRQGFTVEKMVGAFDRLYRAQISGGQDGVISEV